MKIAAYQSHLMRSEDLATTELGLRGWLASLQLEKNRRATPFIEQARALKYAVSRAKHPVDLEKIPGIKAALAPVSGGNFVEELVYRFLITRGDTLGGSMR